MLGPQLLKEADRLGAGFQQPERLGFQAKVEFAAGIGANLRDMLHTTPNIGANESGLLGSADELLEGAGHRAHAALDLSRQQPRQQLEEAPGVFQPLRVSPVRPVNASLTRVP